MRICHIVGAGEMEDVKIHVSAGDLLIAADGGYAEVQRQRLKPDFVVGDFDSLGAAPDGENVVRHPPMKDDTDTMLAVKMGFENGYSRFCMYGMLGGRLDHTIANIQTLMYIASHGGRGYIIGRDSCVCAIKDGDICFSSDAKGMVSVFSMGGIARGVDLEGLLYPLKDYALMPDIPLGVSNEFVGRPARIGVADGTLVVVFPDLRWVKD